MSFYTMHFAYATEDWSRAVKQKPTQQEDPTTIEVLPEELPPSFTYPSSFLGVLFGRLKAHLAHVCL